jgi:hypothetical protein
MSSGIDGLCDLIECFEDSPPVLPDLPGLPELDVVEGIADVVWGVNGGK